MILGHPDATKAQHDILGYLLVVMALLPIAFMFLHARAASHTHTCDSLNTHTNAPFDQQAVFAEDSGVFDEFDELQDVQEDFALEPTSKPSGKRVAPEAATSQTTDRDDVEITDVQALKLDEVRIRKSSKTAGTRMEDAAAAQAHAVWSAEAEGASGKRLETK